MRASRPPKIVTAVCCVRAALLGIALAVIAGVAAHQATAGAADNDRASTSALLPIDEPVKAGMDAIRSAVIDNHTLITHRRFPPPMAAGLKARIDRTVTSIRTGTALSGAARTALDAVLTDIEKGAALVGPGQEAITQIDGLFLLTRTLERYGAQFAHPGWAPIQER